MPYYKDNSKRIHDLVVVRLAQKLRKESPENKFYINPKIKRQKPVKVAIPSAIKKDADSIDEPGSGFRNYYPDIMDETAKIAYEVHWKGERKEEAFDHLPEGWTGIDVFITHPEAPRSIVVKMPDFEAVLAEFDEIE